MTIEAKIINSDYWFKIQIISVSYGFSQQLMDGKWVNTTEEPERHETEILTLGKYFEGEKEAQEFMDKKCFKSLIKNLATNWA
jgi:hypothetical protein